MRYSINKNKYLTDTELEALTATLSRLEHKEPRNTLMIRLALRTGARASELLALTKADIDHEAQTVLIKGIKGSDDREIPLNPKLFKKLAKYAHQVEGNQIFQIKYRQFKTIWDNYRPVGKKLHALRHTFAILLYKKTRDIRLLQTALGHRNINNTMVYAQYIYSTEELKKAML